jgi:hypothetical protein
MPGIANCPSCQRELQVPEQLLGTIVQCPACGATFTAVATSGRTEAPAAAAPTRAPLAANVPREVQNDVEARGHHVEYPEVRGRIAAPALCLILTGCVGLLCTAAVLILFVNGELKASLQRAAANPQLPEWWRKMAASADQPGTVPTHVVFLAVNVLIVLGGVAMLRRRLYGLAVAASILAMININECCCLLGLPFGIWSLMVLTRPEVKSAFQ